jgi:pSer/pThr/pTyr-binding forkhead associated (FHA) protein
MLVRLVVAQGSRRKHVFELRGPHAVIGRAQGNAVRIPSDDVSRRHCRLHFHDGYVTVEDLASINGTFLNGQRVEGEAVIRPGDELEIGPATFRVDYMTTPDVLARVTQEDFEVIQEEEGADGLIFEDEEPAGVELIDEVAPMSDLEPIDEDDAPPAEVELVEEDAPEVELVEDDEAPEAELIEDDDAPAAELVDDAQEFVLELEPEDDLPPRPPPHRSRRSDDD